MPDEKDEQPNVPEDWPVEGPSGSEMVGEPMTATEASSYEASEKLNAMIGGAGLRGIARIKMRNPSQYEQLLELRHTLQRKLADTEAAIAALEENPAIERVMRLVSRALY